MLRCISIIRFIQDALSTPMAAVCSFSAYVDLPSFVFPKLKSQSTSFVQPYFLFTRLSCAKSQLNANLYEFFQHTAYLLQNKIKLMICVYKYINIYLFTDVNRRRHRKNHNDSRNICIRSRKQTKEQKHICGEENLIYIITYINVF